MPTTPIWRYMDGYKFDGDLGLLNTEALYFRRAHLLVGDPPEGSYPVPDQRESGREMVLRRWCYINCWQLGNVESAWMWRKYAPRWPQENAVAVVSRLDKLAALLMPQGFKVASVHYIDFDTERLRAMDELQFLVGRPYLPFFHKHRTYSREREARAASIWLSEVREDAVPPDFKLVQVDLNVLIDRIVLPPGAGTRVAEWAIRSLKSVGLDKDVRPSALTTMPAKVLGTKPIPTWDIERD